MNKTHSDIAAAESVSSWLFWVSGTVLLTEDRAAPSAANERTTASSDRNQNIAQTIHRRMRLRRARPCNCFSSSAATPANTSSASISKTTATVSRVWFELGIESDEASTTSVAPRAVALTRVSRQVVHPSTRLTWNLGSSDEDDILKRYGRRNARNFGGEKLGDIDC